MKSARCRHVDTRQSRRQKLEEPLDQLSTEEKPAQLIQTVEFVCPRSAPMKLCGRFPAFIGFIAIALTSGFR
jgi:hypothetical protein